MSSNHSYTEERKNDSYQVNNLKDQQRTDKRKDKNLGDNRSTGDRHIFKVVAVPQEGDTLFFLLLLLFCIYVLIFSLLPVGTSQHGQDLQQELLGELLRSRIYGTGCYPSLVT